MEVKFCNLMFITLHVASFLTNVLVTFSTCFAFRLFKLASRQARHNIARMELRGTY